MSCFVEIMNKNNIPEDGLLPPMRPVGPLPVNIMLVKIPPEVTEWKQTSCQIATLDRNGFLEWPCDEIVDRLMPSLKKTRISKTKAVEREVTRETDTNSFRNRNEEERPRLHNPDRGSFNSRIDRDTSHLQQLRNNESTSNPNKNTDADGFYPINDQSTSNDRLYASNNIESTSMNPMNRPLPADQIWIDPQWPAQTIHPSNEQPLYDVPFNSFQRGGARHSYKPINNGPGLLPDPPDIAFKGNHNNIDGMANDNYTRNYERYGHMYVNEFGGADYPEKNAASRANYANRGRSSRRGATNRDFNQHSYDNRPDVGIGNMAKSRYRSPEEMPNSFRTAPLIPDGPNSRRHFEMPRGIDESSGQGNEMPRHWVDDKRRFPPRRRGRRSYRGPRRMSR